ITLATLDEFRGVFRQRIDAHNGRVVDMAGDSILAIFDSATGAVNAATEAQLELAERNEALPPQRRMWFRAGVNLGDILLKDDGTVYGDGVNVAARLQSMASPGGINVSGTVFDSVRAKIGRSFNFLGDQELKNIAAPVPVYSIGITGDASRSESPPSQKKSDTRPTVSVLPLQVISGGGEIAELAAGLYQDIIGGLTRQTAITVSGGATRSGGHADLAHAGDFQLEGSIRAAGERLRLSFTLLDTLARRQIWSERYDRELQDVFALEDEISRSVASAVRIRIKAVAFEKLRNTKNEQLSVPELLSKAAGYFVNSYTHNEQVVEILRLALERMPDNSMANAMAVMCRYRMAEFSPFAIPDDAEAALFAQ
ncbi:MAG: adenylate/guanylate cyclase domain-containing protein, partial [Gammaproteobacteria bacterium]